MATYDSEKRKEQAQEQVRGVDGVFVKMKIEDKTSKAEPLKDEPMVAIAIRNPFQKILHWIDQLRRKQETVFSIQFKLPLIVVLSLFALLIGGATSSKLFYDWGQMVGIRAVLAKPLPTPAIIILPTATPAPVLVTRLGTLKGSYTTEAAEVESGPVRYILEDKDGNIVFVSASSKIVLQTYIGKRILVTGLLDTIANTLVVTKGTDIEIVR